MSDLTLHLRSLRVYFSFSCKMVILPFLAVCELWACLHGYHVPHVVDAQPSK